MPRGIVLVGLIAHRRERSRYLARLHADHVVAGLHQRVGDRLRQRTGLEPDLVDGLPELLEAADEIRHAGAHRALEANLPVLVDDADRHGPQRHIQRSVEHHVSLRLGPAEILLGA